MGTMRIMASEPTAAATATRFDKDAYVKRLRRIEGQVRGLQRMIEEDTYCIDILTQVSAVTKALQSVAVGLLDEHLRHCVAHAVAEDPGHVDEMVGEAVRSCRATAQVVTISGQVQPQRLVLLLPRRYVATIWEITCRQAAPVKSRGSRSDWLRAFLPNRCRAIGQPMWPAAPSERSSESSSRAWSARQSELIRKICPSSSPPSERVQCSSSLLRRARSPNPGRSSPATCRHRSSALRSTRVFDDTMVAAAAAVGVAILVMMLLGSSTAGWCVCTLRRCRCACDPRSRVCVRAVARWGEHRRLARDLCGRQQPHRTSVSPLRHAGGREPVDGRQAADATIGRPDCRRRGCDGSPRPGSRRHARRRRRA